MRQNKRFFSKILLFGEYALMSGSPALSIPYRALHGFFTFDGNNDSPAGFDSNSHLKKYVQYLQKQNALQELLDTERFQKDVEKGLIFKSNIPLGYGLGSSGALVAAVYDRYGIHQKMGSSFQGEQLQRLKKTLGLMESWFHGKSSGLDPLICYLQKAVKVDPGGWLQTVKISKPTKRVTGVLFLLDTGTPGETQPLVNYYMEQYEKPDFRQRIQSELIPLNENCIRAYLAGETERLFACMEKLSAFTLQNFSPMIPEKLMPVWEKGLENTTCFLKLCGSGGGGMMLGFTPDFKKAKKLLEAFTLQVVQQI